MIVKGLVEKLKSMRVYWPVVVIRMAKALRELFEKDVGWKLEYVKKASHLMRKFYKIGRVLMKKNLTFNVSTLNLYNIQVVFSTMFLKHIFMTIFSIF